MSPAHDRQELVAELAKARNLHAGALTLAGIMHQNAEITYGRIRELETQLAELQRQRRSYDEQERQNRVKAGEFAADIADAEHRLQSFDELHEQATLGNGNATSSGVSAPESPQVQTPGAGA